MNENKDTHTKTYGMQLKQQLKRKFMVIVNVLIEKEDFKSVT